MSAAVSTCQRDALSNLCPLRVRLQCFYGPRPSVALFFTSMWKFTGANGRLETACPALIFFSGLFVTCRQWILPSNRPRRLHAPWRCVIVLQFKTDMK